MTAIAVGEIEVAAETASLFERNASSMHSTRDKVLRNRSFSKKLLNCGCSIAGRSAYTI